MKRFLRQGLILFLILPLAGVVFVGRWFNKLFGKDTNPFKISEAEAQSSCWVAPSCVGGSCASGGGGSNCDGGTGSCGAGGSSTGGASA